MHDQEYTVNERERTVYTRINESFHHADTILGWKFQSEGLGVNQEILKTALLNGYALSIACNFRHYKFSYEMLNKILNNLNTDYLLKNGTKLVILPMAWSYKPSTALDAFQ